MFPNDTTLNIYFLFVTVITFILLFFTGKRQDDFTIILPKNRKILRFLRKLWKSDPEVFKDMTCHVVFGTI